MLLHPERRLIKGGDKLTKFFCYLKKESKKVLKKRKKEEQELLVIVEETCRIKGLKRSKVMVYGENTLSWCLHYCQLC